MATKPLKRWSTDELETAIYSGSLDNIQRHEAERIISERERAPDELVPTDEVETLWRGKLKAFRNRVLAIPGRVNISARARPWL